MKKILGIDVGGTKIAAGLVDTEFRVSEVSVMPTSKSDVLGQINRLIQDYQGFSGIGLGLPGQVLSDGRVLKLGNLKTFKPLNLRQVLTKKFRVPVALMNDAKAFTLAEAKLGSGKNYRLVGGVTLGTGIGAGIAINGKIYEGAEGIATEFGRFPMFSGKVFEQHVREAGEFKRKPEARKYLKFLLSYVILSFNPQIIILGGGWTHTPRMQETVTEALRGLTYQTKTKVVISKLKYAGIIGAALPLLKK